MHKRYNHHPRCTAAAPHGSLLGSRQLALNLTKCRREIPNRVIPEFADVYQANHLENKTHKPEILTISQIFLSLARLIIDSDMKTAASHSPLPLVKMIMYAKEMERSTDTWEIYNKQREDHQTTNANARELLNLCFSCGGG